MEQKIKEEYKKSLGENLLSIISYDNMLIFVTKKLDFETLDNVYNTNLLHAKRLKHIPLFLAEYEIQRFAKIFPLEFLDMQTNYNVEEGKDVLKGLKIDAKNVKKQLEFELASKLIKLRESYFETGKVRPGMILLLKNALPALRPIAKGLLFLKGRKIPKDMEELFDDVNTVYNATFVFHKKILDSQNKKLKLNNEEMIKIIQEMLVFLQKMSQVK